MWGEGDGLTVPFLTPVVLGVVRDKRGIVPTLSCRFPPSPQPMNTSALGHLARMHLRDYIRDITGHNQSQKNLFHVGTPNYRTAKIPNAAGETRRATNPGAARPCSPIPPARICSGRRGKSSIKPARPALATSGASEARTGMYMYTCQPYGLHPGTYSSRLTGRYLIRAVLYLGTRSTLTYLRG